MQEKNLTFNKQIHEWLVQSEAIVINAGAGMGVDSGLPDFRGINGRWGILEKEQNIEIFELLKPELFEKSPQTAWLMYAKRMLEYEKAIIHEGFKILLNWISRFQLDEFILTSNVDEHFQKAGFNKEKIRELHGSIFNLQCSLPCSTAIWRQRTDAQILLKTIEKGEFPVCPKCGNTARPNIYMFRDGKYIALPSTKQEKKFKKFLLTHQHHQILVFEIGSGPHVQSIRNKTRFLISNFNSRLVRINPEHSRTRAPHIGLSKGALQSLLEIQNYINTETT